MSNGFGFWDSPLATILLLAAFLAIVTRSSSRQSRSAPENTVAVIAWHRAVTGHQDLPEQRKRIAP
jgi:hypothetical protein